MSKQENEGQARDGKVKRERRHGTSRRQKRKCVTEKGKQGTEERSRRIRRYINETDETQARNRQGNRKIQISGKQGKSKLQ